VYVINWICSFLTGCSQQCNVKGHLSKTKSIGLSVVQGSGIGHVLYAVMKSDLQAISKLNTLFKYANDLGHLLTNFCSIILKLNKLSLRGPGHCILICFVLLFIAMSCDSLVCVRLSLLIKDYLLTHLLSAYRILANKDYQKVPHSCLLFTGD